MKHQVKWIEDHLGISRRTIRYYESKGVMSSNECRAKNNYREYEDEDIEKIWTIKILQETGYSVNEIKRMMENPKMNFYESIANKVCQLEKKRDEIDEYIGFAKTIKLTGKIPSVKKIGSVKYDEFIQRARNEWNATTDSDTEAYYSLTNSIIQNDKTNDFVNDNVHLENLEKLFNDFQDTQRACKIDSYYQILSELTQYDYKNETIQVIVKLLYESLRVNIETQSDFSGKYTPQYFAKYTAPLFLEESDIGLINNMNYGIEGCRFIYNAISFFGGIELIKE